VTGGGSGGGIVGYGELDRFVSRAVFKEVLEVVFEAVRGR